MTDETSSYVYLTHEEMLEIAEKREVENKEKENTEESKIK